MLKSILITGASSGIGRALAVRAARAGYAVYGVGRNANALGALGAQLAEEGGRIVTDVCDVSDPAAAPALIGRAIGAFGRLDVLVNNAGAAAVGPLVAQTDAELQTQFGTHVIGPLALVREALPALRAARGHVFMVGSGVARVPIGGMGAYPPSKAALRSATRILRRELRPFDIAVTYVDPGAVDTAFMTRAGMPGAPPTVLIAPETVARKILLAIATRPNVLNAAPLSAAVVALAELLPPVTELVLERAPALIGTAPSTPPPTFAPPDAPTPLPAPPLALTSVDDTPHAETRMQAPLEAPLEAPPPPAEAPPPEPAEAVEADDDEHSEAEVPVGTSQFDAALEPLQRRMERAHLEPAFVRGLLVPEAVIDVSEVAMRWAGMPNKHERALTSEVFFALAEWGFLAPRADGRYRVVRSAD